MIYQNYYGIQDDFRTIRVTDKDWGKHMRLGKLEVTFTEQHEIKVRSRLARRLSIVPPTTWFNKSVCLCELTKEGVRKVISQQICSGDSVMITFDVAEGVTYVITRDRCVLPKIK